MSKHGLQSMGSACNVGPAPRAATAGLEEAWAKLSDTEGSVEVNFGFLSGTTRADLAKLVMLACSTTQSLPLPSDPWELMGDFCPRL